MKLDRKDLKRINRNAIFQYVRSRERQVVSCVQISRDTRISLPTVLKHVDYFEQLHLLKGIGTQKVSGAGRKPALLEFVPDAFFTLGVAFDGKYLECACVNLNYKVIDSQRVALNCTMDELLCLEIPAQLERFIADCRIDEKRVISIGLALPSAVDTNRYCTTAPSPSSDGRPTTISKPQLSSYPTALGARFISKTTSTPPPSGNLKSGG